MPFELRLMSTADTLSWTRVRALAYYGPTHDLLHNGPISESSIRGVAEDRKCEIGQPNTWHWKVVDTDLEASSDDPPDNGGRTIAVSVWSTHNVVGAEKKDSRPGFSPPELRLDALDSLLGPLREAQVSIMGSTRRFFMLHQLATHPDHQGRGAAKMMLDWGLGKADEEELVLYLDASEAGRAVYEKRGFRLVRALEWNREPWGGVGKDWHGCMVRQPHGFNV